MPDEQVTSAPVATEQASPSPAPETASQEPASKPAGSWLDRVLGRGSRATSEPKADASASENATPATNPEDAKPATDTAAQPAKREFSDEEIARLVQAETDRREAKRLADAKKAERRELRKSDPFKYAELDEQDEQQQEAVGQHQRALGGLAETFDREVLDPVFSRLAPTEAKAIIGDGLSSIEGRREGVTKALDALKKTWKAEGAKEAEDRLRKDPTFRRVTAKQALVTARQQEEEPDLVAGGAATTGASTDMNDLLRRSITGRKR